MVVEVAAIARDGDRLRNWKYGKMVARSAPRGVVGETHVGRALTNR
jgi:hypothetical protein